MIFPWANCNLRGSEQPFLPPPFQQKALIQGLIINSKKIVIFIKIKQSKPKVSSKCIWRVSSCTLATQRLTNAQARAKVAGDKYLRRFADDKTLRMALGQTT